jgi:hypothetical protein
VNDFKPSSANQPGKAGVNSDAGSVSASSRRNQNVLPTSVP